MDYEEFIGQLVNELGLPSREDGLTVTRAVLTTLGETLTEGEASDLAAPLPEEIGRFLVEADSGQRMAFDEFVDRVMERADAERPDALYHAQIVFSLLDEAVPGGEIDDVQTQLPEDFGDLFEYMDRTITEEP